MPGKKGASGGRRPGAGMKKGAKITRSLERIAELQRLRQRTLRNADKLFNAQLSLAVGSIMIYRVRETETAGGKPKREHILVTNEDEIREVLDENEGSSGVVGDGYYIVTTVQPDSRAIDSMLDRTFGRPTQAIEVQATVSPQVLEVAERLIWHLKETNTLSNPVKLANYIEVAARLRRVSQDELETAVKGYIETTAVEVKE